MAKNKTPTQEDLEKQLEKELGEVPEINISNEKKEDTNGKEEGEPSLDLSEFSIDMGSSIPKYTTELLNKIEEIQGTVSADDLNKLINYNVKGGERPDFADVMLTQVVSKVIKITRII